MQHLDEGTIHSWLDGALSAEEAARVKAHVDECPQCAAAVAEARGFVAASSRILTALDNVPKGVVPVAGRAKPRNWAAWRAAAAVLVVALGSFAVLRERMATRSSAAEIAPFNAQATAADGVADHALTDTVRDESLPTNQTPTTPKVLVKPATPPRVTSQLGTAKVGNQEPSRRDNVSTLAAAPQPPVVASVLPAAPGNSVVLQSGKAMKGSVVGSSARVSGVVLSPRPSEAAMSDASAGPTSIRIVGVSIANGEMRISYEVAPGDTVLFEAPPMALNSIVVTGQGASVARSADTSRTRPQIRGTTTAQSADTSATPRIALRGAMALPTLPDSQQRKAYRTLAARPPSVRTLNGVTTLTWFDPASGTMMRLSGRHSAAELLEIKGNIEQLRAAEAATKKNP